MIEIMKRRIRSTPETIEAGMIAYMPYIEASLIKSKRHRVDGAACVTSLPYGGRRGISRCVLFAWATALSFTIACAESPWRVANQNAPSLTSLATSFEQLIPQHLTVPASTIAD
jgi:hypothetical protein